MAIRFIKDGEFRQIAADFQRDYNLPGNLPVPIDRIAEFGFGIDIIPLPGLERAYDIVGFISKDLSEIRVDEYVYLNQESRFRFTIAHELSHAILHAEIFQNASFQTTNEWKYFIESGIDDADYARLEFQANTLAGLLLVPEDRLKNEFTKAMKLVKQSGLDPFQEQDATTDYIAGYLRQEQLFNVSFETMKIRIQNDSLFELF